MVAAGPLAAASLVVLVLALAPVLAAGSASDCESRRGGAFITFSVHRGPTRGAGADGIVPFAATAATSAGSRPGLRGAKPGNFPPQKVHDSQDVFKVTQWISDDSFIKTAIDHVKTRGDVHSHGKKIPVFNRLIRGTDCDHQWSWHVDPQDVGGWAELATEVCDATPEYIERDAEAWLISPGRWCPWGVVEVLRVEDRRPGGMLPTVVVERPPDYLTTVHHAVLEEVMPMAKDAEAAAGNQGHISSNSTGANPASGLP